MNRAAFAAFLLVSASAVSASGQSESDSPYGPEGDPHVTPPTGEGVISGRVTDRQTGEPLAEITIDVVGTETRVVTDAQGSYRIALPSGKYALRIWSPGYQPLRVQKLVVLARADRRVDVALAPELSPIEEYLIEEAPDSASIDALAVERKRSAAMGDSLGRAEMSKTPDRNAAQAARRVVGVTIEGNRFVYVRGLGERYTNALLNGVPLPSPEPDRAAIPLDLFPTLVLESLNIVKTFTPDSPADFAGGSVRIETRRIPSKPLFQLSLNGGYNSQATFRERLNHKGSKTDWLGFDSGARDFPSEIPDDELVETSDPTRNTAQGNAVNTFMSAERTFTPPNFGASLVWGDSWKLGKERKLGVVLTLNYSRGYNIRHITRRVLEPSGPGTVEPIVDTTERPVVVNGEQTTAPLNGEERGDETVSWGAYGAVTYQFDSNHELAVTGLHTQLADKTTTSFEAYKVSIPAVINSTRLVFVSRTLDYVQVGGNHRFPELDRAKLDWFASYARATRTEPNTRNTVYRFNDADPANPFWTYYDSSESGMHLWADQYESSIGAGLDWTQPLSPEHQPETKMKLGGLVNLRERNFEARRLALRRRQLPPAEQAPFNCSGSEFQQSCIDDLFVPERIGSHLQLGEFTVPEDAYDAELDVFAGYVMADVSLTQDLRAILGERVEVTRQSIDPYDQFDRTGIVVPRGADLRSTDLLPALALVYSPTEKTKTRVAVTRTLARPQLRELAPFAYSDYFGGRRVAGNPNLDLTKIANADLRFEYFPTLSEVLALSFFFKHFTDPIEPVIKPSGDTGLVTYQNAEGANLLGLELELRKRLGFFHDALDDFSLIGNLTLARSRIQLDETDTNVTNASRAMVNQAPYVLNAGLDYTNDDIQTTVRLSYNLIGPRIVAVGTNELDDAYEQERHTVDLVGIKSFGKHIELKLSAQNLLNSAIVQTQGKEETGENVILRYTDGATYTLAATYTY